MVQAREETRKVKIHGDHRVSPQFLDFFSMAAVRSLLLCCFFGLGGGARVGLGVLVIFDVPSSLCAEGGLLPWGVAFLRSGMLLE